MIPSAIPCPNCGCGGPCDICLATPSPLTAAVTINNVGGPGGGCLACSSDCSAFYNQTFVFDLTYENLPFLNRCYGETYIMGSSSCSGSNAPMVLRLGPIDGSNNIAVTFQMNHFDISVTASATLAGPLDCTASGPHSLTIDSVIHNHVDCCDASGITISLSLSA